MMTIHLVTMPTMHLDIMPLDTTRRRRRKRAVCLVSRPYAWARHDERGQQVWVLFVGLSRSLHHDKDQEQEFAGSFPFATDLVPGLY